MVKTQFLCVYDYKVATAFAALQVWGPRGSIVPVPVTCRPAAFHQDAAFPGRREVLKLLFIKGLRKGTWFSLFMVAFVLVKSTAYRSAGSFQKEKMGKRDVGQCLIHPAFQTVFRRRNVLSPPANIYWAFKIGVGKLSLLGQIGPTTCFYAARAKNGFHIFKWLEKKIKRKTGLSDTWKFYENQISVPINKFFFYQQKILMEKIYSVFKTFINRFYWCTATQPWVSALGLLPTYVGRVE